MNKIQFLKEEIESTLNSFKKLDDAKKEELMEQTNSMNEENLLELLTVLYKMKRDFIEAEYDTVKANDEYIKSLNTSNE